MNIVDQKQVLRTVTKYEKHGCKRVPKVIQSESKLRFCATVGSICVILEGSRTTKKGMFDRHNCYYIITKIKLVAAKGGAVQIWMRIGASGGAR